MPYSALADKKNQLIRKSLDGSVFIADESATGITNLTTGASADLSPLPTGYSDLGFATNDGATFGRETELSDVTSFGSVEPTRSDITRDTITLQVAAQETKLITLQLYTGTDLSTTTAAATTGEFSIAKPNIPSFKYYRVLALFVDETSAGEIYIARYMPRARITEFGEQQYQNGDEAITYPMTFTGYEDATAGYSHRWIFAGPGWKALLADMGITQAT